MHIKHYSLFASSLFSAIALLLCPLLSAQAQESCCGDPGCRERAIAFAREATFSIQLLGPCPAVPPSIAEILRSREDTLKWWQKKELIQVYNTVIRYRKESPHFNECVLQHIDDLEVIKWMVHFNAQETEPPTLPSPNFGKGWSLFLDLNMVGVSDLYRQTEAYSSRYSILAGRTIGRNQRGKERRFRWLAGATMLYQQNDTDFFFTPRVEYRLSDIAPAPVNLGALKFHLQGHVNDDNFMADVGVAFETYTFGINLISAGYQRHPGDYYFHSGFFINLVELSEKRRHKRN